MRAYRLLSGAIIAILSVVEMCSGALLPATEPLLSNLLPKRTRVHDAKRLDLACNA